MFRPSTTLKREPRFTVRLISLCPDVYISLVQIGLDRFAEALHQSTAHSFFHGVHRKWKAYTSISITKVLYCITCRRHLSFSGGETCTTHFSTTVSRSWPRMAPNGYACSAPYISQANGVQPCRCLLGQISMNCDKMLIRVTQSH